MKQLLNVTFIITVSMKSVKPLFNYQGALLLCFVVWYDYIIHEISCKINMQNT